MSYIANLAALDEFGELIDRIRADTQHQRVQALQCLGRVSETLRLHRTTGRHRLGVKVHNHRRLALEVSEGDCVAVMIRE